MKNSSSKNLLQQCMINLMNNFESIDDFVMQDADMFDPEFEFDCKSSRVSSNWNRESPYYNKNAKHAREKLSTFKKAVEYLTAAQTNDEFEPFDIASDDQSLTPTSEFAFSRQASTITGDVCIEKYSEPAINKVHIGVFTASKHKMDYKVASPAHCEKSRSERPSRLCEIRPSVTPNDFLTVDILGRGSYSIVNLVCYKPTDQLYALKIMSKDRVAKYKKLNTVMREKTIMSLLDHPNVARIESAFQDEQNLYFVLEYYQNGDLASLIKEKGSLDLDLVRYYSLKIIDGLDHLRKNNIVHRDLKPENCLLDEDFKLKISDFGSAKVINPDETREQLSMLDLETLECDSTDDISMRYSLSVNGNDDFENIIMTQNTFVGTPLYVSPEMLQFNLACFASDLWALGCIIYEAIIGVPPFRGQTQMGVFSKILECSLEIPSDIDPEAEDLILKLLRINPFERLGSGIDGSDNDLDALKNHPFFKS